VFYFSIKSEVKKLFKLAQHISFMAAKSIYIRAN